MPAHNVPALVLRRLTKSFGRPAIDRLDLTIAAGEFYALLGPNGAGKTTTLRLVAGLLPADDGDIEIFGIDARRAPIEAKRIVAWLPDEPMLYDKLDPLEYLEFVAGLWSVEARRAKRLAEDLLESLGLWPNRRDRCEGFSRGMRQKLALAGALIHEPRLLMLDEPLTGLDAAAARQVKDILTDRVRAGATIIMTTHILEVAERLADQIGIIARGKMIAEGTLDELRASVDADGATLETVFGRFSSFRSARFAPERARFSVDVRLAVAAAAGGSDRAPVRGSPHRRLPGRRLAYRH
jgi:ABC-2 type transport system ATP-binding protein